MCDRLGGAARPPGSRHPGAHSGHAAVNGVAMAPRVPNTSKSYFDGIDGEAMVIALDLRGFAVSTGAACSCGAIAPSHVLTAIGLSRATARAPACAFPSAARTPPSRWTRWSKRVCGLASRTAQDLRCHA